MVVKYPCKICKKPVAVNHNWIQCDRCGIWVHTKCNKITKQTYKLHQKDKFNWYCIICTKTFLPFSNLNDEIFISTVGKKIPFTAIRKKCQPEQEQFLKTIKDLTENWLHNKTVSISLSRGNKTACPCWWQSKPFSYKHVFPRISLSWIRGLINSM